MRAPPTLPPTAMLTGQGGLGAVALTLDLTPWYLQVHTTTGLCQLESATFLDQCQSGPRPLPCHDRAAF